MKMTTKLVVVLSSLMLAGLAHADGKANYTAKCKACHGADGKGSSAMVAALKADPKALDLIQATGDCVKTTTEGRNKMPSFKGKLSDAEVSEICAYIKTLK